MYAISRANLDDAPAMLDLQRRAFAEEGRRSGSADIPPLAEQLDAVIDHVRNQTALVARDDAKIVGTIRGIVEGRVAPSERLPSTPRISVEASDRRFSALLSALSRTWRDSISRPIPSWRATCPSTSDTVTG